MTNAKRGRGSRHGSCLCAVAALGFALSGCGGGGSGAVGTASTSQASTSSVGGATGSAGGTSTGTTTTAGDPPTATTGVTINWQPPTENTDGTALTNLAGYDIHYGTASGQYTQTITVSNPGIATYVVDNLTPGKYYFTVAAVNSAGTESPLSPEVSATVTN